MEQVTRKGFLWRSAASTTALLGSGAFLAACGDDNGAGNAKAEPRKSITIGFANVAPYCFVGENGEPKGQAPEVAQRVLKDLGFTEVHGVLTEWGSLIGGLLADRFDMVAAGMFITPERCTQVLFSDPDYAAQQAFAVERDGAFTGLSSWQDVAGSDKLRLGLLGGSVELGFAKAVGVPKSRISVYQTGPDGMEALKTGRVDAFALPAVGLQWAVKTMKADDLVVTTPFFPVIDGEKKISGGGYAFKKKDTKLRDEFNTKLRALMQEGVVAEIVEPYGFTKEAVDAAQALTASKLCSA